MGMMHIGEHQGLPLVVDDDCGVIRIRGTRLKLQTVIAMYYMGCKDPEEMALRFETLQAETARSILEWYHTRQEEVDAYMEWVNQKGEAIRAELEPQVAAHRRRARRRMAMGVRP